MAKKSDKSQLMTSFHRVTYTATVAQLKKMFGEPTFNWNDGESKTNMEWVLETTEKDNNWDIPVGTVFTLYDWKEYRPLEDDDIINWHIGTHSKFASWQAQHELHNHQEIDATNQGLSDDIGLMKDLDIID